MGWAAPVVRGSVVVAARTTAWLVGWPMRREQIQKSFRFLAEQAKAGTEESVHLPATLAK